MKFKDLKKLKISDVVVLDDNKKRYDAKYFLRVRSYLINRTNNKQYFDAEELRTIDKVIKKIDEVCNYSEKKDLLTKINYLVKCSNVYGQFNQAPEFISLKDKLVKKTTDTDIFNLVRKIAIELGRENVDLEKVKIMVKDLNNKLNKSLVVNDIKLTKMLNKYLTSLHFLELCENKNDKSIVEEVKVLDNNIQSLYGGNTKIENNLIDNLKILDIKKDLVDGKITLVKEFSPNVINSINFISSPVAVENKRIFTIDSACASSLDGAFSVSRDGDCYKMNVYVADVPSFLKENPIVCEEAYKRGCSIYFDRLKKSDYKNNKVLVGSIDMLPRVVARDQLSLLNNRNRMALDFEFIFDSNGNLISGDTSRKNIVVTNRLTPKDVRDTFNSKGNVDEAKADLLLGKELMEKIASSTNYKSLANLNANNVSDYQALPSLLINHYIGENSDFTVYRENGKYSIKPGTDFYTQSSTPLRKFVSNINLAFYLNQVGVESFDEKKLNYVENNIDEILYHLNETEVLAKFVKNNSNYVRKYVK